jgi:hypothetical protein
MPMRWTSNEDRFETVLEEVAAAAMASIEGTGVPAERALQATGQRYPRRTPEQVQMIRHEAPCVTRAASGADDSSKAAEEVGTIDVVGEDGAPFDAASDHMVKGAGGVEARAAGHGCMWSVNNKYSSSKIYTHICTLDMIST